jgi:hypothetical protein
MNWIDNAAMYWGDGNTWNKITDHNRQPIAVAPMRIENSNRMANGTLRRYVVAKKKEWTITWDMIPDRRNPVRNGVQGMGTVDNGWAGKDIEAWHDLHDGAFYLRLRSGDDMGKVLTDDSIEEYRVMITSFSKDIVKRGVVDFWNLSITLTEV